MANACHRGPTFTTEVMQVETAQLAQLDPFQMRPEPFVRVQLGGIDRIGFGTPVQALGQPGELRGGEPARGARWPPMA